MTTAMQRAGRPVISIDVLPAVSLPAGDGGQTHSAAPTRRAAVPTQNTNEREPAGMMLKPERSMPALLTLPLLTIGGLAVPATHQTGAAEGSGQLRDEAHTKTARSDRPTGVELGHARSEARTAFAGPALPEQGVRTVSDTHSGSEPQSPTDDLVHIHALIGHYARQLWDVQQQRIAASNRVASMERDGLGDYASPARAIVEEYEKIEKAIDRELAKIAKRHFMADWIAAQRGIGLPGFARLLGVTGNIDRFGTVSKLWKYLGLHVTDGHAPKRVKGEAWTHTNCGFWHLRACPPTCETNHHPNCVEGGIGTAYAPQGRVICHQIGEAIVKVGGDGWYRRAYDEKKAYYEAGRPDWSQARRHNAAMRYAVKELIKHLWVEWHTRRGLSAADTHNSTAAPTSDSGHSATDTRSSNAASEVAA